MILSKHIQQYHNMLRITLFYFTSLLLDVRTLSISEYGEGTGQPIAMSNVACQTTDTRLSDCTYTNALQLTGCTHARDVGISCQNRE